MQANDLKQLERVKLRTISTIIDLRIFNELNNDYLGRACA